MLPATLIKHTRKGVANRESRKRPRIISAFDHGVCLLNSNHVIRIGYTSRSYMFLLLLRTGLLSFFFLFLHVWLHKPWWLSAWKRKEISAIVHTITFPLLLLVLRHSRIVDINGPFSATTHGLPYASNYTLLLLFHPIKLFGDYILKNVDAASKLTLLFYIGWLAPIVQLPDATRSMGFSCMSKNP